MVHLHGEHPMFQSAKDCPASWGATFSCMSSDLIMSRSLIAEFYVVIYCFKTFDASQNKRSSYFPYHKSWLVIGDNFIGFSSLCDFGMFDVSKTFCTRTCIRLLFENLNIPKRLIYSVCVCVVTFGWELVVCILTPSIFGRFLVHAWD
jgi:hypothetical protein